MGNIKENFNMFALGRILANVAMVGLLVVWVLAIQNTSNKSIQGVEINIASVDGVKDLVLDKEIYEIMKEASPVDIKLSPLKKLDIALLEQAIKRDNRIYKAEVYVDAQQKLIADITQRRPILRIKDEGGRDYYLDQDGNYVNKSQYRAVRVPVVTGHLEKYQPGWKEQWDSKLSRAYRIGRIINNDDFLSALVEQIHFERSGRIVIVPKIGTEKIVIDYMEDIEEKLTYNLKQYYKEMAKKDIWGKYKELDISYKKQVIGRNFVNP